LFKQVGLNHQEVGTSPSSELRTVYHFGALRHTDGSGMWLG